jgi:hypothetical protein
MTDHRTYTSNTVTLVNVSYEFYSLISRPIQMLSPVQSAPPNTLARDLPTYHTYAIQASCSSILVHHRHTMPISPMQSWSGLRYSG